MKISIGQYLNGHSIFHRTDPRVKIISMFVLMILIFLLNRPISIAVYGIWLIVMTIMIKAPLKVMLKTIRSIWFIATFALVVNLFTERTGLIFLQFWGLTLTTGGIWIGFKLALRLIYLVLTSSLLLTLTTTPIKIADALESMLKPLEKIKFPAHEMAMMMSIALRFIPTLADETEKIMKAQSSRGANYDQGSFIKRAKGMITMLIPLFISSFKRADDLALAMEARCYNGGHGRTKLHPLVFKKLDAWMVVFFICMIVILCLLEWFI